MNKKFNTNGHFVTTGKKQVLMTKQETSSSNSVRLTAVIISAVCGVLAGAVIIFFIWRRCARRKKRQSTYEPILSDKRTCLHIENGTLVQSTVSMKQIPFTVPTNSLPRRLDRGSSEEYQTAGGGGGGTSEPTSPLSIKRPSVEIPGAYALGAIDPSLYKIVDEDDDYEIPPDHIGRVWFAVEYERETEKLLVTLIKAKNLPTRQYGNNSSCDPFIRIYLMPDERRYLQSKFKKKTCNPKFEESFVFQVSYRSLQDRLLKLTVFDVDRHKRHNIIGHALYPLKDHDGESNERLVIWRDLEKEVTESTTDKGELLIALSYNNHLERLTVGIFEGRSIKYEGLSPGGVAGPGSVTSPSSKYHLQSQGNAVYIVRIGIREMTCSREFRTGEYHVLDTDVSFQCNLHFTLKLDSLVKVCLLVQNKVIKTKKTEVVKKSDCPNFNESFTIKLPVASLDAASLSLTVVQHSSGHKDKVIGRVILGSFMFARGKELDHWNEMVANQKDQITHWHALV